MSYGWLINIIIKIIVNKEVKPTKAVKKVAQDYDVDLKVLLDLLPNHYK